MTRFDRKVARAMGGDWHRPARWVSASATIPGSFRMRILVPAKEGFDPRGWWHKKRVALAEGARRRARSRPALKARLRNARRRHKRTETGVLEMLGKVFGGAP